MKIKNLDIVTILKFVAMGGAIVLIILHLFDLWDGALKIFEPLMGVVLLLQGVQYWKDNRPLAIVSIAAAVFVIGVVIALPYI